MKTKETFRSWFADLMLIGVFPVSLVGIEKIASSDLDHTLMQGFDLVLFLVYFLGWANNWMVHEEKGVIPADPNRPAALRKQSWGFAPSCIAS